MLAEELGRSRGAVVTRLRQAGLTGRVVWADGEEAPRADRELAYLLTVLPAQVASDPGALVDALVAEDWPAVAVDGGVTARRGDVVAWVGLGDLDPDAAPPEATSRWWLPPDPGARPDCPARVDGVVVVSGTVSAGQQEGQQGQQELQVTSPG